MSMPESGVDDGHGAGGTGDGLKRERMDEMKMKGLSKGTDEPHTGEEQTREHSGCDRGRRSTKGYAADTATKAR